MTDVTRGSFSHRGFELSYLDSAPEDAARPVVLLLHGFPDTSRMWSTQIEALHAAGYRCVAPDTLGCGESDMAPRVRDYNAERIASDHAALLDHLGIEKAHVVGHDWGAVLAWVFAGHFPQRTDHLVVMSVGDPTAYARAGLRQKLIGWYVFFFQLGGFADWLLGGDGHFGLANVFRSHPQMEDVVRRLSMPGRLTAALRIYRAAIYPVLLKRQPNVSAPTLAIWSEGDRFLTEAHVLASEKYVDTSWRYERLIGHHWIAYEQPEKLNQLILEHIS